MASNMTKLQRWLDLLAFLVGHRYPVSVEQVFEHVPAYADPHAADEKALAAGKMMFERDKRELRAFGIPIETVEFTVGGAHAQEGYRLASEDFYLPYLRLIGSAGAEAGRSKTLFLIEPEEARDARDALHMLADMPASPLAREARSALRKLSFDLEPTGPPPLLWVEKANAEEVRGRLAVLSDALRRRKRVAFGYHGIYRGERTERDVDAYGLLFRGGHWYLIGHDHLRDDVRIFRADRMEEVAVNRKSPQTPDYEVPDDFDLERWREQKAWHFGEDDESVEARVKFRFPRSLWAERNGHGRLVERLADGDDVRAFEVRQVDPFLRWILAQAGDAEILSPPELGRAYADLLGEVRALYRDT